MSLFRSIIAGLWIISMLAGRNRQSSFFVAGTLDLLDAIPDSIIELHDDSNADGDLDTPLQIFKALGGTIGPKKTFGRDAFEPNLFSNLMRILELKDDDDDFNLSLLCRGVGGSPELKPAGSSFALDKGEGDFILLVPMKDCHPIDKVIEAQRLGAKHVIFYNELENMSQIDLFDCTNRTEVKIEERCGSIESRSYPCQSDRCVMFTDDDKDRSSCCAFDIYPDYMTVEFTHFDRDFHDATSRDPSEVVISSTFLTYSEGVKFRNFLKEKNQNGEIKALVYDRWYPEFNISNLLVCILSVAVLWFSSYRSASQYRFLTKVLETADIDLPEESPPVSEIISRNTLQNLGLDDIPQGRGLEESNNRQVSYVERAPTNDNANDSEIQNLDVDDIPPNRQEDDSNNRQLSSVERAPTNDDADNSESQNLDLDDTSPDQQEDFNNRQPSSVHGSAPTNDDAQNVESQVQGTNVTSITLQRQERNQEAYRVSCSKILQNPKFRRILALMSLVVMVVSWVKLKSIVVVIKIVFGCLGTISTINFIARPALCGISNRFKFGWKMLTRPVFAQSSISFNFLWMDIVSIICGFTIGMTWMTISLSPKIHLHTYEWFVQNIMCISICAMGIDVIQVRSVRYSVILLAFISCYLTLIQVSSYILDLNTANLPTGGSLNEDPYYCQKYPEDRSCSIIPPIPFALVMPKINDFRGGMTSISLLEILLPGLLCGFAARYDATKYVARAFTLRERAARRGIRNIQESVQPNMFCRKTINSGYFCFLIASYAFGVLPYLLVKDLLVIKLNLLVFTGPLVLLALFVRGSARNDLSSLWYGPRRIALARDLLDRFQNEGAGRIGLHQTDEFTAPDTRSIISFSESDNCSCQGLNDLDLTQN